MTYEIKISEIIASLYNSSMSPVDANGNWRWDAILNSLAVPDDVKVATIQAVTDYYNAYQKLPSILTANVGADNSIDIHGPDGAVIYHVDGVIVPVVNVNVNVPAPDEVDYEEDDEEFNISLPFFGGDGENSRTGGFFDTISVFHPWYWPNVFAHQHKGLWLLWLVGLVFWNGAVLITKAAVFVTWKSVYWTMVILWLVIKYGTIWTLMFMIWAIKASLILITAGMFGRSGKKGSGWSG
jgi:hypothetical protein